MKVLYFFLVTFSSLVLMLMISPLRGRPFGMGYSSIAGFTVFFFLTLFCLNKFLPKLSSWQILTALFVGLWLLILPIRIIDFEGTMVTLPDSLLHTLGIICGFLYWRVKSPVNIFTAFLGFAITIFMFFQGYDYWLHKLNFGTFTGKIKAYKLATKVEGTDKFDNTITERDFADRIVLLDFWNTSCGVCFQKFPQVQALSEKYKNDSSVIILAVNEPIEEDKPKQAFQIIEEEGYTFPVLIPNDENLPENFGVKYYPTTFVIDSQGTIIYKGSIEGAIKQVDRLRAEINN